MSKDGILEEVYKKYTPQLEELVKVIVEESKDAFQCETNIEKAPMIRAMGFLINKMYRMFSNQFELKFVDDVEGVTVCATGLLMLLHNFYPRVEYDFLLENYGWMLEQMRKNVKILLEK